MTDPVDLVGTADRALLAGSDEQFVPKPRRVDARLIGPAVAAWAGAFVALVVATGAADDAVARRQGAHLTLAASVVAAVLAVVLLIRVPRRKTADEVHADWRTSARVGVAVALIGAVAGIAAAALHVLAMSADPVAGWAQDGRHATVVARVESAPTKPSGPAWQSAGQGVVRIRAQRVTVGSTSVNVDVPMAARIPITDTSGAPPIGSIVSMSGTVHTSRSTDAAAFVAAREVRVVAPPDRVDALANDLRAGLVRALDGVDPGAASLVNGLAVGGTSGMPPLLEQDMRTVGLSHLTAVSGGNVAIVLGAVLLIAGMLRLPLTFRIVLAVVVLAFFIILVRPQPSVLRAAVMGAITVLALLSGGRRSGPSVLAAAVLVLVVLSPPLAVSWGFALSVMATAGIVLLAPVIETRLHRLLGTEATLPGSPRTAIQRMRAMPPVVVQAVALTTAAQVMTAPLIVAMGATIGWAALPANLLAAPAVPPVTILGLLAALVSPVSPLLASMCAKAAAVPAAWIAVVAERTAALPGAVAPIPPGLAGVVILAMAAALSVAALVLWRMPWCRHGRDLPSRRRVLGATVLVLAVVVGVLAIAGRRTWVPPGWFLVACDVGQGDALLLRSAAGATVLIDTGPEPVAVDRCLSDLGLDAIDLVLLTHYDADHIAGLAGAMHGRTIGRALLSPVTEGAERADEVAALLAETPTMYAQQGQRIALPGIALQVLWPRATPVSSESVQNDNSIVALADVDGVSVLLTGDIEQPAQAAIARMLPPGGIDIAKVPHHGSGNMDPALAVAAHARLAVFSVGADNDYGHPHADALTAWGSSGALLARTDTQGPIAVTRDASGALSVTTQEGVAL